MKVRQWFVSNSSSSSFIVLCKSDHEDNWLDAIQQNYYKNHEDYEDYEDEDFVEIEGFKLLKYEYKKLKVYEDRLRNGFKLISLTINSEDGPIETVNEILETLNANGYNIQYNWDYEG